jgi:iron complex outermembrane receptor protein
VNTKFFLTRKALLLAAATPMALAMGAPAFAQDVPTAAQNAETAVNREATQVQTASGDQGDSTGQDVVVTGSLFRQTTAATPSPVTTITTENLDQRGINTIQSAIQNLASNNGPAITNSFTANGAFASGASAASLRGLSTNSTLVLFDGLRAAYYPLSDDGTRNFVDLNTIPDEIVDRIDVLRDGASSTYGADAIAGVINIITKRSFQGIGGRAEAGISERGVRANQRLTLTAGYGDLDEKGFNAYLSGFYYHEDEVKQDDLPSPFNSSDQRSLGLNNNIVYGYGANGAFPNSGTLAAGDFNLSNLYVRAANATTLTGNGRYQLLSPQGCLSGTPVAPGTAAQALSLNASLPNLVCQEDSTNRYGVVSPHIDRMGGSGRVTVKLGDTSEAYVEVNFQQTTVGYTGGPPSLRATGPTGILFPRFSTSTAAGAVAPGSAPLSLPVFVCAAGVNCATAADRRLNPNNPFAASGQNALVIGSLPNLRTENETRSRAFRAALGIQGTILGDIDYRVNAVAMHNDLRLRTNGYVYIQNLLNAVGTGSFNFLNPYANSQAQLDQLAPENVTNDSSDLDQLQVTLSKALFDLPGGPLQFAVGGEIRYEAIDAPSANDDYAGPTQRYFTLNAFGTSGNRTVSSAFFELQAPIFDKFEINGSGRYDHYSSGQNAFSPKVGAKFTPFRQLAIRGTWSRGFRIPSFAEANALPTTGYVTNGTSTYSNAFLAQYSTPGAVCSTATFQSCPTYIRSGSYGLTTLASPNLDPEKSRSFTAGAVFEPIRNVALTVDFFDITKTGAITGPDNTPALIAYSAGAAIPAGFTVVADAPDVNTPNARPRIAFVQSQLINANRIHSQGIDIGGTAKINIAPDVSFTLSGEGEVLLDLSTTQNGVKQKYNGTLGNFNLTAGSGTPEWHANMTGTLRVRDFTLSATANYFDGYDLSAMDQGGDYKDCSQNPDPSLFSCRVPSYTTVDLVGSFKVNDKFTFYVNVLNALDDLPPIDPVTYGAYLYNPIQGGEGIYGRQFRAGVKVGF